MSKNIPAPEGHTLLDRFDQTLDEFHVRLNDIKNRREQNLEALQNQDVQEIKQAIVKEEESKVQVSSSSFWNFWIIGAGVTLLGYFFFQSLSIIYLFITGIILSMASEKFILFFEKWMPRGLSIGITYLLIGIFLLSGIVLVIPFLISQTAELLTLLIDWALVFQDRIQNEGISLIIADSILPQSVSNTLLGFLEESNLKESIQSTLVNNISQIVGMGTSYIKNAGDFAVGLLSGAFSAMFQILIVFTIAVFGSLEKKSVVNLFSTLSSTPLHMKHTIEGLYDKLGNRLVGQLLLCLSVGILVGFGLMILNRIGLGLPSGFTLALIAGLTEFIPYLGPILGGLPGIFVATLAYGFKGFIAAGILYSIVQRSENNILVPLIMSQTLGISPLLIFVMMLVLGSILGLLGVIIAVPITVIVNIVYKELMNKHQVRKQIDLNE